MMQRLRHGGLDSCRFLSHCSRRRGLCSLPDTALIDDLDHQVLVEGKAWSRTAVLNRPSVLNSLTTAMGLRLQKLYRSWEDNPDVGFIALKGSGKAFCAGGDVVSLYHLINQGRMDDCKEFFRALYPFIYLLGTCLKPHVAILNGVTMGGGAGVSIPGTFRIATDKTVFATPETLIGFHPDAGASFYLSHLPGHVGEFLALTSEKLNGPEMVACGLATHYLHSSRIPLIEEDLGKLVTDDPSVIEACFDKYGELVQPDKSSVLHRIELLDECFSHDTVEEIIDALEREAGRTKDPWCISTLKRLKDVSPLSLKVSLRSIREGRYQTLDQCLVREYRMSLQGSYKQISGDFCEGVRARLVEKDSAPKWDPSSVEKVTKDMVDQYFLPLSEFEPDLELPTELREAFI
ncbi:PREDICTED: 3-hydroxyisobutyryl-CoA hydrolase-like protein 1, mitochondrial isoform X2 [Fragaria vesca subsp. vesca]|uniref:3-hydroxyisobutyryl-CoA hydrolase-like protein 1, mitochondrial isoform X2 n=1 Tax=Fragaria vesca subsp. vesca TaxID=101020 RepID=UPI0002C34739|nr:PREDICTED: 3-hydroxyisobutyryl-CoA hydrolase-like protein 1, mitochondrial isoform X2 [Fragaria vesca subsp. vesca]